jgi:ectoine hydroxylase-related dioxygenase (phytanoyl-CoA dioxygenase family)
MGVWWVYRLRLKLTNLQSFLPGSHKKARISSRFVRAAGGGTTFEPVPGVEPNEEKWDELDGWRQAACPAGTLVLIHGSVMHRSPPNPSDKTRMIYTFHMIEGGAKYDEKNWLQPTEAMPFPALFDENTPLPRAAPEP